jgi:uncharacterized OsmC-like protein
MATITTTSRGDGSFEAALGRHRVLVDVPESMGGSDRGPTSTELFVASLGSCVAAFVADWCARVGLDATDLSVDVSYEQAEEPTRLVDLDVAINLPKAEVGERLDAIRRVAEHCPVHETVEYTLEAIDLEVRDATTLRTGAG